MLFRPKGNSDTGKTGKSKENRVLTYSPQKSTPLKLNMLHLRIHPEMKRKIIWPQPSFSRSMLIFGGVITKASPQVIPLLEKRSDPGTI